MYRRIALVALFIGAMFCLLRPTAQPADTASHQAITATALVVPPSDSRLMRLLRHSATTPGATSPSPTTTQDSASTSSPSTTPPTPSPAVSVATQPTTTSTTRPTGAPASAIDESTYDAWTLVADCESGTPGVFGSGWGHGTGGAYVGDLGITQANWSAYGGGSDTSPAAQIAVASRIQAYPPDQDGVCRGW